MQIEFANEKDLLALIELYHSIADAMIGTPHDCYWRKDVHPSDAFIGQLVRGGGMLAARGENENEGGEGALVGAVGLDHDLGHDYGALPWIVDVAPEEMLVIHLLAMRPDLRGQGLSHRLLDACIDEAKARGMRSLRLDVTVNNAPALGLYERAGFVRVGEGPQLIGGEADLAIRLAVMELPL